MGVPVEHSVPLHKLKVTTLVDGDDFHEISKILSHRYLIGKTQYLVQWKNPISKNLWVNPEDFANMKFINDYINQINQLNRPEVAQKYCRI